MAEADLHEGIGTPIGAGAGAGTGKKCDVCTFLPIERYADFMAINPDGFHQCHHPDEPSPSDCNDIWLTHGYVGGADRIVGRYDVCQAIAVAESLIADFLGFYPAPNWTVSEKQLWPRPKRGVQWDYPPIRTNWGHLIAGGIRALSAIEEDAEIDYTDEDGDGVPDTATITIAAVTWDAAGATIDEVDVFYTDETDDCYRIRNLTIYENAAGQLILTGPRSYFVDPTLWLDDDPVNLDTDANFLTYVDVYRRYNDTSTQATLIYSGTPGRACATSLCEDTEQDGCLIIDRYRIGAVIVVPASYSAADDEWTRACFTNNMTPNSVRLWYQSGLSLQADGRMRPDLAEAIVRLANALLPEAPCGCDLTRQRYQRDREEQDIDNINTAMAVSHFGTTARGATFAMGVCRRLKPIVDGGNL